MPFETAYKKEILQEYEQIRFRNRQLLNERIQNIRKEVPRIAEIDAQIRDMTIDAALAHDEPVDEAFLAQQTQTLIDEKYEILKQAGYPSDYLSAIYTCTKCSDTGYINHEPCDCMKQKMVQRQYKHSNLGSKLEEENFKSFCLDYYSNLSDGKHELTPRANMENIYHSLLKYIEGIDSYFEGNTQQKGSILFQGSTGVGKTFLSNCVAKELLDKGYAVLYVSAGTLFEKISDVIMNKNQIADSQSFYQAVNECDILIIDDLGTEYINNFTASYLYTLLNDRLLRRKATIISTNLSLTDLRQHYSERIFSRICDSYLIYTIYGDDIRFVKRKAWQSSSDN